MSLSHPSENPSMSGPTGLSGPEALRAYFAPRQVLQLKESAECLGLSYSHFYRRVQAGTLNLRIRKNEIGERYVLLDDLIRYIFPPTEQDSSSPPPARKRGPGRPRKPKSVISDGGKGGAR